MTRPAGLALLGFALALAAAAQSAPQPPATAPTPEQNELKQELAEAGNSAVDVIRALEQHLAKYPDSPQRPGIELALVKAAIEANDKTRILLYGEKVLAKPSSDFQLFDRVIQELVEKGDPESAKKALAYLKRYQKGIAEMRGRSAPEHFTPGQWHEQMDRTMARSLAFEAGALGNTGDTQGAIDAAERSWATFPTGQGAREAATWLAKAGRDGDALRALEDAFTLEDPASTPDDRAKERARIGALYAKLHGSEKGLGDEILAAYDRNTALMAERSDKLRLTDPNAEAVNILDFTLTPVRGGAPLVLSTLKGKTVVIDFWATWCIPCRAEHPLLAKVREHFKDNPGVFFLALDADDDLSLAAPFLKEQGWDEPAWFEGGLERKLMIGSIPTVLVLDPAGRIVTRITGLNPEHFEETLTERIQEALGSKSPGNAAGK